MNKDVGMQARCPVTYFPFVVAALYCTGSLLQVPISVTEWKPIWGILAPLIVWAGIGMLFRRQLNGYMTFVKLISIAMLVLVALSTVVAYAQTIDENVYQLSQGFAFSVTSFGLMAWLSLAPDQTANSASRGMIAGLLICMFAGLLETFEVYRFPGSSTSIVNWHLLRSDIAEWAVKAPVGGWWNPNGFAACMVILSIAALARGRFWLLIYFACAFLIVRAQARLCVLALFLGSIQMLFLRLANRRSKIYAVTMISLALGCAVTIYWHTDKSRYEDINPLSALETELDSDASRVGLAKLAFEASADSPFLGSGPGFAYSAMTSAAKSNPSLFVSDTHNQFATIFVEFGVIAGTLMLILSITLCLRSISFTSRCSSNSPIFNSTECYTRIVWGCVLPILWFCQSNSFGLWPLWMVFAFALRNNWTYRP
jgi:hypothetical protein